MRSFLKAVMVATIYLYSVVIGLQQSPNTCLPKIDLDYHEFQECTDYKCSSAMYDQAHIQAELKQIEATKEKTAEILNEQGCGDRAGISYNWWGPRILGSSLYDDKIKAIKAEQTFHLDKFRWLGCRAEEMTNECSVLLGEVWMLDLSLVVARARMSNIDLAKLIAAEAGIDKDDKSWETDMGTKMPSQADKEVKWWETVKDMGKKMLGRAD